MRDPELEAFKSQIDLRQFAASMGYALDASKSGRSSAVMRLGEDRVIVRRGADGHWIYCSVHDDSDAGSIIDFVQNRKGCKLGGVRKELRPWVGINGRPALPLAGLLPMVAGAPDRLQVEKEWMRSVRLRHGYLDLERSIPGSLLASERFAGRMRMDGRSNVLFPHEDIDGALCGFEKKNRGFTGFAAGGEKGLWRSNDFDGDVRIVFAESGIDALSYAALFPDAHARYRSFAGGLNRETQPALIRAHIAAMPPGSEVVAATDQDESGHRFAEVIAALSDGYVFRAHLPTSGDWNDVLRTGPATANRAGLPVDFSGA